MALSQIFVGNIFHCTAAFKLELIENGFILVQSGKVTDIGEVSRLAEIKKSLTDYQETALTPDQFLIPGLIDCHIHASQYPNCGIGYDMELLDWLLNYTFPLESKYKDAEFAKKVYDAVVKRAIANGTTTACYFGTIHTDSCLELARAAVNCGQRALIGKVNMTKLCPDYLRESSEETITNTERFIRSLLDMKSDLVSPIVTPRFALSCDMRVMRELGELARKYDLHIQTHISENASEVLEVEKEYGRKYAMVYDNANLLTKKTVLAHAVHLGDDERRLLAARGSSVAHCPASNTCLQSGLCDVRGLIDAGVATGLGTDIAGGASPSIVEAMRHALTTSIHIKFKKADYVPLTPSDVFYLATLGGAKALSLDGDVGNFVVGKDFDAVIVDMGTETELGTWKPLEVFQKFVYTSTDRNIWQVFVAGKRVK